MSAPRTYPEWEADLYYALGIGVGYWVGERPPHATHPFTVAVIAFGCSVVGLWLLRVIRRRVEPDAKGEEVGT